MFLLDPATTVADLVALVLRKFEVIDIAPVVSYFGIFQSPNGSSIGDACASTAKVVAIAEEWSRSALHANSKFIFMIRLFMPSIWGLEYNDDVERRVGKSLTAHEYLQAAAVRDAGLIHLQYLQAVYGVITGQYQTSAELAIKLGMLHFTQKFGKYNPSSHKVGFLGPRIVEFIPLKLLKQRSLDKWEQAIIAAVVDHHTSYEATKTEDEMEENVQKKYLDEVFAMTPFGCTLFRCKVNAATSTSATSQSIPLDCVLGIHHMGIHIFDKGSSRNLAVTYRIEEIFRWGFRVNEMFYFEVQSTNSISGVIEFDSVEGEKISGLLSDYAHAFVAERDLEDARALTFENRKLATTPAPPASKKAIRVNSTEREKKTGSVKFADLPDLPPAPIPVSPPAFIAAAVDPKKIACVVRVQAVFRGYKARCMVSELIEKMLEEGCL